MWIGRDPALMDDNDRLLSQCEMAELLGITERSQQRFEQVLFAKIKAELAKRGITAEDAEALLGAMQELGDEENTLPCFLKKHGSQRSSP